MAEVERDNQPQTQLPERDAKARALERLILENRLRRAVEDHEFMLRYQPKINLRTGAIAGTEALIRWMHPGRGLIAPGDFLPVAEACGLMAAIGTWVIDEACRQAKKWNEAKLVDSLPMAINISATQLRDPAFVTKLSEAISHIQVDPHHLELELSEDAIVQNAEIVASVLKALTSMGIRLAMDDFRMGECSLSDLKQLGIDTLKIGHSLIHGIGHDLDGASMITVISRTAKEFEQRVIAKGVETEEQFAFLCATPCDQGQGYFFSKPLPAPHYTAFLKEAIAAPDSNHSRSTSAALATASSQARASGRSINPLEIAATLQKKGPDATAPVS